MDSYTGLPLEDDELGASRSTPTLLPGTPPSSPTKKASLTPLLDQVLRGKSPRESLGLEATGSLQELGTREGGDGAEDVEERGQERKNSSFADLLESRDEESDKAWMNMQVQA